MTKKHVRAGTADGRTGPVLVVDDDADIRYLVRAALSSQGLRVIEAGDAAACRRLAGGAAAVILDRVLPDGDGLDLLEELRREATRRPLVLLTTPLASADHDRALAAGAEVLVKPFDPQRFGARVRDIIARHASLESPAGSP